MQKKVRGYEIKPFANLEGANLEGADLRGANITGTILEKKEEPQDDKDLELRAARQTDPEGLKRLQELERGVPEPPAEIVFEGKPYTRADLVSPEKRNETKRVVVGGNVEYFPSN